MKTKSVLNRFTTLAGAMTMALASAGVANATLIDQNFSWATGSVTEGGIVTFDDDLGDNQFRITFDNTSSGWDALITGIVFNLITDIDAVSILSFKDGDSIDITGWKVGVNVNNETTPGKTKFDIAFETTKGVNGGIYNDAVSSGGKKFVPDIATLILKVTDPVSWTLASIGQDSILRMQQTGADGEGSLKIITSSSSTGEQSSSGGLVPEPGVLSLLGIGLLGQALLLRQRRRRQQ